MPSIPSLDICLNLDAFLQNDDGTWTVIEDTKIRSDRTEFANTLLLQSGTRIDTGMFFTNEMDLVTVLKQIYDKRLPSRANARRSANF